MRECLSGCGWMLLIFFTVLMAIAWLKGYPVSYIEEAERATLLKSRPPTPEEIQYLSEKAAERAVSEKWENGLYERTLRLASPPLTLKATMVDRWGRSRASEPTRLDPRQFEILVISEAGASSFTKVFDLEDKPEYGEVALASFGTTIAMIWLTTTQNDYGTNTTPLQRLHLKMVDLQSATETFTGVIQSQKYGLRNVAVCHHSPSDSLAFAWEDISRPNYDILRFAVQPVADFLKPGGALLKPFPLFQEDKWEKRAPAFIISGENVFLAITTGDEFGMFAHSGKPCIGISLLGSSGMPSSYGIIASTLAVRGPPKVRNMTIFFDEYDQTGSRKSGTRAIEFSEVYKVKRP